MSIIHSLRASAAFLSFCALSQAWVLHRGADKPSQDGVDSAHPELRRDAFNDNNLAKKQEVDLDCSDNRWQDLLNNNPSDRVMTFCNEWLGIAPATAVVQFTPTITVTTSNSRTTTVTSTERTITSVSTTKTATSTLPPLTTTAAPVKARAANIIAVAEDIINSVIVSGTTAPAASTKNEQRIVAESGLANACSCKMVDPTATVTSTFTVPPVYTTVGYRKLVITRITDTLVFTASTTISVTPGVPISSTQAPDPVAASSSILNSSGSQAGSASQSDPVASPAVPTTTLLTASVLPSDLPQTNASATNSSSAAIVTAIPFSCPDSANKRADQVVGDFRFEYQVLCNTEIISESQDRVGYSVKTNTQNDCAAQCSVLNAKTGNTTCQAAAFTPYTDGRKGGDCVLSTSNTTYAPKEGAVAIVNTGVSSNGDECADLGASASYGPPVDTAALVASITSAGVAVSTPGLITQTADGGVFETYVSANSTDASGYIHWSWYRVSASSSYWWAVYGTSWACTKTITPTIVQAPPTSLPLTTQPVLITTIINGATTTIISGSFTTTIVNQGGGGMAPPTFVPASVTSGSGEFTTFFSEATATSTADNGIISPTGSLANITFPQGTGAVSLSFATSTYFSTGTEGIIAPSPSAPVSPPNGTVVVSSGSARTTTSGSTAAFNSTGGSGVIPPGATNETVVFITSTTTLVLSSTGESGYGPPSSITNWTYPANSTGFVVSSGAANLTRSFATQTANSTGDSGVIPPVTNGIASSTTGISPNSTGPLPSAPFGNSTTGGSAAFTTSGGFATSNSTGSNGVIPPNPTSSISVGPSILVSSGSANGTFGGSTATINSTGGNGVIPPAGSTPAVVLSTGGSSNFTSSGGTAISTRTGDSGVIPPASVNATSPAGSSPTPGSNVTVSSGGYTSATSGSTAVSFSTGDLGVIPPANRTSTPSSVVESIATSTSTGYGPPFENTTVSSGPTPSANISSTGGIVSLNTSSGTATYFSTGTGGVITPFANSTVPSVPTLSANSTSSGATFTNSEGDRNGSFRRSSTRLSSSGFPVPSSNSSTTNPPSASPTPSLNSTTTGPTFTNSSLSSTRVSESSGFPVPSLNSTITSPPSGSPTPSINVTSTGSFSDSGDDRNGSFRRSSTIRPSSGIVVLTANSSVPVILLTSTTTTTLGVSTASLTIPTPSRNLTTSVGSSLIPPTSVNVTSTPRSGTFTEITPSANISVPLTTGTSRPSSSIPAISSNATTIPPASTPLIIPPFANSTVPPGTGFSVASVSTPAVSLNSTLPPTTRTVNTTSIPSFTPSVSLNSTVPSFTPSVSLNSSFPSFTPSISLNSSTPSICPTAAIIVTETTVAITTQLVTTTLLQIQTVTVSATPEPAVPLPSTSTALLPIPSLSLPADLESRARLSGQAPTESQIAAACADSANIVLNPDFTKRSDATVPGWSVDSTDPNVTVDSYQDTGETNTTARFSSAAAGRPLTITQPLTLCPGTAYTFSARTRQSNTLAACNLDFTIASAGASNSILKVVPKESNDVSSATFTAGAGTAGAEADLRITARCDGFQGFPVSDDEGWMRVEVGAISVVKG